MHAVAVRARVDILQATQRTQQKEIDECAHNEYADMYIAPLPGATTPPSLASSVPPMNARPDHR